MCYFFGSEILFDLNNQLFVSVFGLELSFGLACNGDC